MRTPKPGSATETLTIQECWKFLGSSYIGRLAVINGSAPEIFPVNFVPAERALYLRTAPGTKLRSLLIGSAVALETDALNVYGTEVWSVVVKGVPLPVEDGSLPPELADPDREPGEPGLKEHLVRIDPTEITGRRFAVHSRMRWWPPLDFTADWE